MLEIFRCELEATEQASLAVRAQKSYEKHRENYTAGALYQARSCNLASGSRSNNKLCLIIHYFVVLKLLFQRI